MGGTRLELMTSSVSGKRATNCANRPRWRRDSNPCARICSPLPRLSATPPVRTGLAAAGTRPTPSGRRDSNPRPSPWQGDALPTEPRPRATRACGLGAHATITTLRRGRQTEGRRGRPTPADVRAPCGFGYRWGPRAIGAVVARFVHTEEVTGSNPVSPTAILPSHSPIAPRNRVLVGNCTFAELSVCHAASRRHGISSRKRVTSFNLTRWAATRRARWPACCPPPAASRGDGETVHRGAGPLDPGQVPAQLRPQLTREQNNAELILRAGRARRGRHDQTRDGRAQAHGSPIRGLNAQEGRSQYCVRRASRGSRVGRHRRTRAPGSSATCASDHHRRPSMGPDPLPERPCGPRHR